MFRHLRLRLTLLYLLVALLFIGLLGTSTYLLLSYYFQSTIDLALQHRMAEEIRRLGAPVPPDLAAADLAWSAADRWPLPVISARWLGLPGWRDEDSEHARDDKVGRARGRDDDADAYHGELAAIFVLPLRADGSLAFDPNPAPPPIPPAETAVAAARERGHDLRTIQLSNGTRVRLLTYPVSRPNGPAFLQLGRTLTDQDRLLSQFLVGLAGLGGVSAVLLGAGSWWLAGRTLRSAQLAWERQQAFIANSSHELRTPLTLVRASAEVALRQTPADDADQRALLSDVLNECDHMARLVDDLLLLSRLDAGRLTLERKVIALPDLLGDVGRQFSRLAAERDVAVVVEDAAGAIWGDPARVRQVLLILLDNALRHTPAGGTIRLGATPRGRHVDLVVADTGSGIPPEHLPHVFERFYRVDRARTDGGAGLGLSIAKALITAQRGSIRIDSAPGQGTRVVVTLPRVAD